MYRCVTIPQSKIKDFCQPPLHKGAFYRLLFAANFTAGYPGAAINCR